MAKTLSTFRDATALVEVGRYLLDHAENSEERAALKRIGKMLVARREAPRRRRETDSKKA